MTNFDLDPATRNETWAYVTKKLENYYTNTEALNAATAPERATVLKSLVTDFDTPVTTKKAIDHVIRGLSEYAVHTPHPAYYGMFNPRANFPSIIADALTATFNPQLAAWGHAPYAVEVEHLLIREMGKKFGYKEPGIDGVFTTGGQEANLTAVLAALNHKFPEFAGKGLQAIKAAPVIYCSEESHHSIIKAAKVCGLGARSVHYIPVDEKQQMIPEALKKQLQQDIKERKQPIMIMATLGTTGTGAIDPVNELADIASEYKLWLHADAAYGGAVVLTKDYKYLLDGIEKADSITFDAHKWLSIPMGASMFITKHASILGKTFGICANYMPEEEDHTDKLGSYTHSIQWSRRFIGLKLYMSLLVFGWKGYDETLTHQIRMGMLLREKLNANGWTLYNDTELPIICFNDVRFKEDTAFTSYIYESFLETGEAWIARYTVGNTQTLRACITNYATNETHLDTLTALLNKKRAAYTSKKAVCV